MQKAAELAEWSKLWHPRGKGAAGPVKRGLGLGFSAWAGGGHASQCLTTINADGSVIVELGSQDLGTGTRTIITQVAAETLGLPMSAIKLNIGDNSLPDRRVGRLLDGGRRFVLHAQIHDERAGQAL